MRSLTLILAEKLVELPGIGPVRLQKKRHLRTIRLRLGKGREVMVSLPASANYRVAIDFVLSKKAWLDRHRQLTTQQIFKDGQPVGKTHHLYFRNTPSSKLATRLEPNEAVVYVPSDSGWHSEEVQTAAKQVRLAALKTQAQSLLLKRVDELAKKHDFQYRKLRLRAMHTRWGSCTAVADITLNIHLMELPWELIDYVIIHELVHTKVLSHSHQFWMEVERCLPHFKQRRKLLRTQHRLSLD